VGSVILLFERRVAEAHPDRPLELADELKTKAKSVITNASLAPVVPSPLSETSPASFRPSGWRSSKIPFQARPQRHRGYDRLACVSLTTSPPAFASLLRTSTISHFDRLDRPSAERTSSHGHRFRAPECRGGSQVQALGVFAYSLSSKWAAAVYVRQRIASSNTFRCWRI
jgi:hypothetical protein